ncbi:unnamed protein product [Penicillium nalgiovense]|nr:unnamed protein product [Penicillium nalgiovense]
MHGSLFLFLLISVCFHPAQCAPIPDGEPSYVSGPDGRGTIELLWSCSITFGLCIWTAMHPNVIPWDSFRDEFLYKLNWMVIAVFTPEIVVCTAASQRFQARQVRKDWEKHFSEHPAKDWLDMSGAFFVVMGGFIIKKSRTATSPISSTPKAKNHSQESSKPLHSGQTLVTCINQPGFKVMLDEGIIRRLIDEGKLTKEHFHHRGIKDKGKADGIAKFLVTIQIIWMGVQCLGRKLNGLPLSLLEAHVLIQMPFAVVAYIFWWQKPLDVSEPIRLPIESEDLPQKIIDIVDQEMETYNLMAHFTTEKKHNGCWWKIGLRTVYDFGWHLGYKTEVCCAVMAIVNGGMHALAWNTHFPTAIERNLWRAAAIGTGLLPCILAWELWVTGTFVYGARRLFEERMNESKVHWLWKLASMIWGIAKEGATRSDICAPEKHKRKPWPAWTPMWVRYLLPLVGLTALLVYAACVAYLAVESFASTRSLPKGGFATVEWTDFFPHV